MAPLLLQLAVYLGGLAAVVSGSCIHGTSLMRRYEGSSLVARAEGDFSYHGENGPLLWGTLGPGNAACSRGRRQTPINIRPGQTPLLTTINDKNERPKLKYGKVSSATWANLGKTVQATVGGTMTYAGQNWTLRQFHIHAPSEHHLSDEFFLAEVHFVHERTEPLADGSVPIAVLGVFMQGSTSAGLPQPLQATIGRVSEIRSSGSSIQTGELDFKDIEKHFEDNVVYRYEGSLTTPGCDEVVTWGVSGVPFSIDVNTFNALKSVVKYNSRYTQNDPGRPNLLELASRQFCPS